VTGNRCLKIGHRRLSLRGLRTFCVVARHRSFRRAAEELCLTASAVSHQIRHFERELGTAVFERRPNALGLTRAGAQLFEEVDALIHAIDEAAGRVCAGLNGARLRISVQPFFASELFVPRLADFAALHPDIEIDVDASDQASERHLSGADLSIRLFRAPPPGLLSERLFRLRLVAACSPALAEAHGGTGPEALARMPLIVHAGRPNAWTHWARYAGVDMGEPTSVVRLDTMISIARAAERGLGAALVPLPLCEGWFRGGKLVPLAGGELLTRDAYYAVLHPQDAERPEVQALRDWILREFGALR